MGDGADDARDRGIADWFADRDDGEGCLEGLNFDVLELGARRRKS